MKKTILLFLTAIIILLASCTDAHVYYRLGRGEITAEYTLKLSSSDLAARTYSDHINEYWEKLGFTSEVEIYGDTITIIGEKTENYSDERTAAEIFSNHLSSNESILDDVTFQYTPSFEYDDYYLSATLSLEDVIRQYELQDIPENDLVQLLSNAQDGEYSLTISLPGKVIETNADENSEMGSTWEMAYGEERQIVLKTRDENTAEVNEHNELVKNQKVFSMLFKILGVAAGFILLLIIVLLIVRKKKRG